MPSSPALEECEPLGYWPVTGASRCLGSGRAEPPGPTALLTWGVGVGEGHRQEVVERLGPLPPQLLPLCNSTDQ